MDEAAAQELWLSRLLMKLDRLEQAGKLRAVIKRDPHTNAITRVQVTTMHGAQRHYRGVTVQQ